MKRSQDQSKDSEDPFNQGVDNTLRLLHQLAPLDTWMLTRVEGNEQIVVRANDHGYGIKAGTAFDWSNSFCIRMLEGRAPRIAPDAASEPAYAEALEALAAAGNETPISSYIGYPVRDIDHQLYGVLCAIHPDKMDISSAEQDAPIQAAVGALEALIRMRHQIDSLEREREALFLEAHTDTLTGAYNRRGWTLALAAEEDRCARHGLPAGVVIIDLNGLKAVNDTEGHEAGDRLIATAGRTLRESVREVDTVARLGGDEFAALFPETPIDYIPDLARRLRDALDQAGVSAALGACSRDMRGDLQTTQAYADKAMYEDKHSQRAPH
ncbi:MULTISPECIES: sensor domain-containing diguanylate cyclase [unclassified Thioalkalivibrio]|uniref:sensor domain-containing diguanylate cyclase n=1 Tax=unclassified Thioalkalivibrio TaxID=2621013 RepID=UPI00037B8F69|nr:MULTISPECIES: sensor domain-containing diguanylate cyclase [unclassified Thioalkalivibrio]